MARVETGRPALDWRPACATANTCGAGYANAWPKAKGAGEEKIKEDDASTEGAKSASPAMDSVQMEKQESRAFWHTS